MTLMKNGLSFRTYKEGDEEGIFELFKAVYPERGYKRDEWLRWWRWLYKENPAGQGIICLAEHDGKIVGHRGPIPVQLNIGDNTILGLQSTGSMTHPDYRRRGIFETLANRVQNEAVNRGIDILFGFPNKMSYPGYVKKLQWFDVALKRFMLKPLNWENIVKLKVKNRLLRAILAAGASLLFDKVFFKTRRPTSVDGLAIRQITSFDKKFDEFWNNISGVYPIMLVRNKEYLNWKYNGLEVGYDRSAEEESCVIFSAEKANKIYGYVVLKPEKRKNMLGGLIFDLLARSEEAMQLLIDRAVTYCRQNGIDFVYYPFIAKGIQCRLLKKAAFISPPFMNVDTHFVTRCLSASISEEFIKNPDNWLI